MYCLTEEVCARPTVLEVSLDAIVNNLKLVKRIASGCKIIGVVKANAYGLGLIEVSRTLAKGGVDSLGIALVQEGAALRKAGIETPSIVMGAILPEQIEPCLKYDLQMTVGSIEILRAIESIAKAHGTIAKVQLKIDTGMNRVGVSFREADEFFTEVKKISSIEIAGVYSHFATAETDEIFAREQIARFKSAIKLYSDKNLPSTQFHMANSAATFRFPEARFDAVRPGIALYGVCSGFSEVCDQLELSIRLKSKIVFIQNVQEGESIGYNRTWFAKKPTQLANIPIGYGDGYFIRCSNHLHVLIEGNRYPIVGRVSMDQLTVDIGDEPFKVGEEVVLIGSQKSAQLSIPEISRQLNNVDHEIFTAINSRVPRRYVLPST